MLTPFHYSASKELDMGRVCPDVSRLQFDGQEAAKEKKNP
jgi:hypothetical protein